MPLPKTISKSIALMCMLVLMGTVVGLAVAAQPAAEQASVKPASIRTEALPVIPGAVGFGITTPAGRGGTIYKVTSLDDDPIKPAPGTLRYALNQPGPRIIVFEVSGTIRVDSKLTITNPYVTIAGQTAPSPGIFLRGAVLNIATHDVLIQHIRIAPGDDRKGVIPNNRDCFTISSQNTLPTNVVVDHITCTWSVDELYSAWNDYGDVTLRHILATEPLNDSIHIDEGKTEEAPHGYGPLFYNGEHSRLTFTGNLIGHATSRLPFSEARSFVMVNNVIYDPLNFATYLRTMNGVPTTNSIVGNVYLRGPSSRSLIPIRFSDELHPQSKVYLADNWAPDLGARDQWDLVHKSAEVAPRFKSDQPLVWNDNFVARPAAEVLDWVLANVGARPADRLPYEQRIVDDVRNRTGRIIDAVADVGGWPEVPENYRELVIPENPHGDDDGDGYTNVEEWLHQMAAEVEGRAGVEAPGAAWRIGAVTDTPINMGATVSSPLALNLQLQSDEPVRLREVKYTVDGRSVYSGTEPPRNLVLNRGEMSDGRHTMMVTVTDEKGRSQMWWREFQVSNTSLQVTSPGAGVGINGMLAITTSLPPESIKDVRVTVGDKAIYTGTKVPGELKVDTLQLQNGQYEVAVQISTTQGTVSQASGVLDVKHTWELKDELLPPIDGGWWGTVSQDMTSDRSDGWEYVGADLNPAFDPSRLARRGDGPEYLVWATPKLQRFTVVVFVQDPAVARSVALAVSADGTEWQAVPYSVAAAGKAEPGRRRLELTGAVPAGTLANHFRLTLPEGKQSAGDLQLGAVTLLGHEAWVE